MITYTQLLNRCQDITGTSDADDLQYFKQDINQGLRLFKNAARRYYTRQEKSTDLVATQQYYQLPSDMVRVTEVRVVNNGINYPLKEVQSEYQWNQLNVIPAVTINVPTYYFVRGYNEIGLWPTPSMSVSAGLKVSYEPRLQDMSVDDITGTATFTNDSVTITDSGTNFTPQMVGRWIQVTDGTDGNWYKIGAYVSSSVLNLENYFQGITGSRPYTIGLAPDIPEDYHLALVYYASYNFFLKRKDNDTAQYYKAMFDDLFNSYRSTYSDKTTGLVQNKMDRMRYNIFNIPPNTMT